jgi:transposase
MPSSGLIVRKNGKYRYVYKVLRTYRNEKGQPTNDRKLIGKLDESSNMLIPNDNYYKFYGEAPKPTPQPQTEAVTLLPASDSVRSVGASWLIRHILDTLGVTKMLENALGAARAAAALTAVIYMVCKGNVFEHVGDWCEGFTLDEKFITSQASSELFASISAAERMKFFHSWIETLGASKYWAYDVTSFSSYAEGIQDTEWGHNRDGDKLPQINMGCYLDQERGLPVFYVTYPGSIVDKSHLPYMMAYNEELGVGDVCFVMDRGFCSTANVRFMHENHLPYVMGVEIRNKAARQAIDEVRSSIQAMSARLADGVYAAHLRDRFYGETSTLHIYYDPALAERQRSDFARTLLNRENELEQKKTLNAAEAKRFRKFFVIELAKDGAFSFSRDYDKIDAAARNNGFFCLLSDKPLGDAEALGIYRKRDKIEKGFDDLKNHIDMKRLRTQITETTDGKLFCAFVALIAASELTNKLRKLMEDKCMSKDDVISELEKIKSVELSGGKRLMNPLTKKQRLLLEPFGLGIEDLKRFVAEAKAD